MRAVINIQTSVNFTLEDFISSVSVGNTDIHGKVKGFLSWVSGLDISCDITRGQKYSVNRHRRGSMCSRCDQPKNVTNRVAFLESFNQLIYATLSTVKESSSVWRHSAYLPRSYFLDGKEEENTGENIGRPNVQFEWCFCSLHVASGLALFQSELKEHIVTFIIFRNNLFVPVFEPEPVVKSRVFLIPVLYYSLRILGLSRMHSRTWIRWLQIWSPVELSILNRLWRKEIMSISASWMLSNCQLNTMRNWKRTMPCSSFSRT